MNPGDLVHYQPDLDLPGAAVMLLKYETPERSGTRTKRAFIAWWEEGVLEQPNGVIRHGYRFRRYRWVPLRHLAVLSPALRHRLETA